LNGVIELANMKSILGLGDTMRKVYIWHPI